MFSRSFYLVMHILGIAFMFAAMGGVAVHAANGGTKGASRTRTLVATAHGLGALLILTGGFGMMARLGMNMRAQPPGWLMVKMVIWLLLSAVILLPYRSASLAKPFFIGLPLLAGVAAYMVMYKPF
ncbi:MAG: hypothetical protein ABJC26_09140 [Gemmatimonadaceae bacterium]